MKKLNVIILAVLICVLLSGCSGSLFASIDDLISPVSLSGDDAGILLAVDDFCNGSYSIKIPSTGKYTTSFITCDLDGNNSLEAIAFFEPNDNLGNVNMAVLSKTNEQWKVTGNVTGEGSDVKQIDIFDLNNDGRKEVIVCWSVLSNSTMSNLCVYTLDDEFKPVSLGDSITASDFTCLDMNNDDINELLVFKYASINESPKAELYSFKDKEKHFIGQTKLDSSIVSFSSITKGNTDAGLCVYADGVCSDGKSMVTEFLYWSDYYDSVISPFYSYSTGKTSDTSRNNLIICRDINGDGFIEIPLDDDSLNLPEGITAQNWVSYERTVLNSKAYSIACKNDGYLLMLSKDLLSQAKFIYDSKNRELKAFDGDNEIFSILTTIKSSYDSDDYSGYTQVMSDSGLVYLACVNSDNSFKLNIDTISTSIKTY